MNSVAAVCHGVNIGHGFVKWVVITNNGDEWSLEPFPSLVARATETREGAPSLINVPISELGDGSIWWTGEHARIGQPLNMQGHERLLDTRFIPALVAGAIQRWDDDLAGGRCVSGLPASWSLDRDKAQALGARLREGAGAGFFSGIRVIAEPLGALYSLLLDTSGQFAGDPALRRRVGVVDIGYGTVDLAVIQGLTVVPDSLATFTLGASGPLQAVHSLITRRYEVDLPSLSEVDTALRQGYLRVGGEELDLPAGWADPFIRTGEQIAGRMLDAWRGGAGLDAIVISGGGSERPELVEPILAKFRHARVAEEGQIAIPRGYARYARHLETTEQLAALVEGSRRGR